MPLFLTCIYEWAYFCSKSVEIQTTLETPSREPSIPDLEIHNAASR